MKTAPALTHAACGATVERLTLSLWCRRCDREVRREETREVPAVRATVSESTRQLGLL